MPEEQPVTRREFLLGAAGGAALVASRLAHGPEQGKPPLTTRSINRYIATAEREDESTRFLLAAEVKRNALAFLEQRFALSDAQRRALEALTEEDRRRIAAAVEMALRPGHRLVFRNAASPASDGVVQSARAPAVTLTVAGDTAATRGSAPNAEVILSWPCPAGHARRNSSS